jgi:outer membrane protein assembly factor BamB
MHRVNSPAASTPTTDGQRIYAYFGSFGLVCYDLDGTECWRLPCPAPATSFGSAASPIVVGEFVIVLLQGRNAHVLAVERKTGKPAWTNDRLVYRPSYSTPVVWKRDDAEELIVHGIGGVSACNPRDGQVRWWISGLPIEAIPSPIISEGRLFVAGSIPGGDPDHRIPLPTFDELLKQLDGNKDGFLAHEEVPRDWVLYRREGSDGVGDITLRSVFGMIDANKDKRVGRLEWGLAKALVATANDTLASIGPGAMHDATRTHIAWRESRGLPEVPSPLCYRGRIYLVKNGGVVSCLDALTGKLHFRSRLGAGGTYYASPVAGDGKVYFASESGVITVIEAADSLKVLTRNDFGEAIYATPALVQGAIYVRTAKQVYAFGKKL